jgi:polar amino acid transport system substrate-binding protein
MYLKRLQAVIMASALLCMAVPVCAQPVITMLVEEDCPYSCKPDSEMGRGGFVQEILITIFERHGYTLNFTMVPWLRALSLFNDETPGIDGMIAMKVHPIRKTAAVFPDEEIAWYLHSFYVRSDSPLLANWQYEGIESLVGIRVGCVKGWNYCDKTINRYLHAGEAPAVQPLYGGMVQERNFRKLIAGRIDLWVANRNNTEYMLSRKRKKGDRDARRIVRHSDLPVTNAVRVYPVFRRNEKGKRYAEFFTAGMRALRRSGELQRILSNYNLVDWKT